MFDHVTIRVPDLDATRRFYTTVLATLGHGPPVTYGEYISWDDFLIAPADADHPATHDVHIGFVAPSPEAVDAFWQAGVDAGYPDDGPPGPRTAYGPDYYGGFLRDRPSASTAGAGNSVEAVRHGNLRRGGVVDHVWIRVADLPAARAFYETIAPHAGYRLVAELDDRVRFAAGDGRGGSLSLVADGRPRSEHLHLAFHSSDDATVDTFHAAALAAGHRDHGAPGLRPEYHAGYYGAFVLDPDGTNVEVVHHNPG